MDANGNISANNIGGTGSNTVNGAVNVAYTEAKKHATVSSRDSSVTVTESTNANGGVNYDLTVKQAKATEVKSSNNSVTVNSTTNSDGSVSYDLDVKLPEVTSEDNSVTVTKKVNSSGATTYNLSVPQYDAQINKTNNRISNLENTVRKNRKRADAGAATAIPQVF